MGEGGLEVVFLKNGVCHPNGLGSILRRATEIKKVKEKCCPKKGKK